MSSNQLDAIAQWFKQVLSGELTSLRSEVLIKEINSQRCVKDQL